MKTTAPAHKAGVIAQVVTARRAVLTAAQVLSPEKQGQVFLGSWSPIDLLAHLQGWDVTNRQAIESILAGQLPEFYAHRDKDWATYNAHLVQLYRQEDFAALLAAVSASHRQLVERLEQLPASEFDQEHGLRYHGYRVTIARLMEAEARDELVHNQQLRQFARL